MNMFEVFKRLFPRKWYIDLRQYMLMHKHMKITQYAREDIAKLRRGELDLIQLSALKPELIGKPIIWQYWGQGVDREKLPEVVQHCFASIDKHANGYTIIRLSDSTVGDYIDMPQEVKEALYQDKRLSLTHYSDLLRLALLTTYGGIWLDATILLTAPLPSTMTNSSFWSYQRSPDALHKEYWRSSYYSYWGWQDNFKVRILNSILLSHPDNILLRELFTLLVQRLQREGHFLDYFMFQIYFQELVDGDRKELNCPIVDDTIPHLLQTIINGGTYPITIEEVLRQTSIHKMSYYSEENMPRFYHVLSESDRLSNPRS